MNFTLKFSKMLRRYDIAQIIYVYEFVSYALVEGGVMSPRFCINCGCFDWDHFTPICTKSICHLYKSNSHVLFREDDHFTLYSTY